ncbi:hypothetical protein HDF18_17005 [Mucilaginibacter sp. X5P1]|uniref:hypothetical protein n=1 Tax=Mucilaginibacter sp. X5P1 TaxID=2723088 RepID=UPI001618A921|nr:hypothetical protein [Mucilaginibacter sp. X5P1]MBB6139336.1 hypothetical protein [Mucilaginibacter sp. X5P1]
MEQLPIYIAVVFILTAVLTVLLLYKATNYSKQVIIITLLWLVLQAVVSLTGYYTVTNSVPPRFALLLFPPIVFIAILIFTKRGRTAMDGFNVSLLTLLNIVRIPVELTLYWLYLHKLVPEVMTFEGRNFDILCGLTAPLVYYWGYIKNALSKNALIVWNVLCLMLLTNIVVLAMLSAPFAFQKFGFEQPNIAIFYFPFVWLPGFIVPVALFTHLAALKRLIRSK